jgi:hypothetical protein
VLFFLGQQGGAGVAVAAKRQGQQPSSDDGTARAARAHQRAFADEISRIAKSFWVQTPARSSQMEALFRGARIERERWLGMTKSWIAPRRL